MFSFQSWMNPIRVSPEHLLEVRREVNEMSTPVRSYFVLVVLSTAIASYGLLANSTAVVIGAMLVAPLMGPIFGIALSLISGARRMLVRATFSEVIGAVSVVFIAMLISKFGPAVDLGTEVLSRTRPTILDIFIALASGLVGAFAIINERTNAALPGVAISTALVPPLATVGVCIGVGEWRLAGGAFVLFLANFLAIELAAAGVFTLYGMRRERASQGFASVFRQFGWSTLLLLVMSFFLYRALASTIHENRLRAQIGDVLSTLASEIPGARLDSFSLDHKEKETEVTAVFLTPSPFTSDSVGAIQKRLRDEAARDIHLVVRSLISSDTDNSGPVYVPAEKLSQEAEAQRRAAYYGVVRTAISDYLATLPGAELANLSIPAEAKQTQVTAIVNTPTALAPEQVADLQAILRSKTSRAINLTVRSLITVDADYQRYLYAPAKPPEPSAAEKALSARLRSAFANQLAKRQPGAYLVSLTLQQVDGRWKVRGICRSPAAITPSMVAEIERDVRKFVSPNIDIVVRTVLESDASSSGYLNGDGE
ncbi:MAG TPA: TIGR00341 family protein [Fimbriimonadaceae bacterium]|nr:TIGR00341 family protein [Fimbriimonadaceae bacterium]